MPGITVSNKWIKHIFEPVKVITSQVTSINRVKMGMSTLRHRKKEIIISTKYFYQIGNFKNFLTKIFEIHCKFENRHIHQFAFITEDLRTKFMKIIFLILLMDFFLFESFDKQCSDSNQHKT